MKEFKRGIPDTSGVRHGGKFEWGIAGFLYFFDVSRYFQQFGGDFFLSGGEVN
jgi:hypothetical protein